MHEIKDTLQSILNYLRQPDCKQLKEATFQEKSTLIGLSMGIAFTLNIFFIVIIAGLEQLGLFSMEDHAINQMFEDFSPIMIVMAAVVLAPVFEELVFRGPITLFCKYKRVFPWVFYGLAILFGYVHITNYEITTNVLLISPILVAPQILLGLLLGYIRVRLGLLYAILFHAIYNGILVIPGILLYEVS